MRWLLILALFALAPSHRTSYPAKVLSVHDGDTALVEVELSKDRSRGAPYRNAHSWGVVEERTNGWRRTLLVDLVRLHGINAPELRETGGIEARERLRGLVNGRMVRLDGGKRDKYGRLLGVIWLGTTNICNLLVSEGLAVHWDGAGEKPSLK